MFYFYKKYLQHCCLSRNTNARYREQKGMTKMENYNKYTNYEVHLIYKYCLLFA